MKQYRPYILLSALFLTFAQPVQTYSQILSNPFAKKDNNTSGLPTLTETELNDVKRDIVQLSSPQMKGRIAGTPSEVVAANYISSRFKEIGLVEIDKNYQRKFSFSVGQSISSESELIIDNTSYKVPSDARPIYYSSMDVYDNFYITGMNEFENVWVLPAFDHQNQLKLTIEEKDALMYKKAKNAKDRGARAVIFYNNFTTDFIMPFNYKDGQNKSLGIPVFEISHDLHKNKISLLRKLSYIRLHAKVSENLKQGINVYGLINNGADKTVIISANYDGFMPAIDGGTITNYPGANNNASGVAAMMILANKLKKIKSNYNYMFIAYSATNFNQSGSEKFLNDKNFFKDKIAYAIHVDKVGRFDITNTITVNGIGTYAAWRGFFKESELDNLFVLINKGEDKSSDYKNYYDKKIPYLSFTTGVNHENGTSDDTYIKIKPEGIAYITSKVMSIITQLDASRQNITFTETKDDYDKKGEVKNIQPGVSLGIIPDLAHKSEGLRIHKVTKGEAGYNADLKEGDIIVLMRNYPVKNYDDYLYALSKFKKSDKVYIRVKRGNTVVQKLVTFQ